MSVYRLSDDKRLLSPTFVPRIHLCVFAFSLSSRPLTGNAAMNSQQTIRVTVIRSNRGGTSTATKNKRKTTRLNKVLHYNNINVDIIFSHILKMPQFLLHYSRLQNLIQKVCLSKVFN